MKSNRYNNDVFIIISCSHKRFLELQLLFGGVIKNSEYYFKVLNKVCFSLFFRQKNRKILHIFSALKGLEGIRWKSKIYDFKEDLCYLFHEPSRLVKEDLC